MAFKNLFSALKNYPVSHIPTLALVVGFISYFIEYWFIRLPHGRTSWLAWIFFIVLAVTAVLVRAGTSNSFFRWAREVWEGQALPVRILFLAGGMTVVAYVAVGCYASFLPVHLVQEYDVLNYHLSMPRQHLIRHSLAHIPWSSADLLFIPLGYALSPFSLVTVFPNKVIQFVFFLGLLSVTYHLAVVLFNVSRSRAWIIVMGVMASHAVAIQVGLAMFDLVMAYCFFAFLHSLWTKRPVLAAVELAFFLWSKSFILPQMLLIALLTLLIGLVAYVRRKEFIEIPLLDSGVWRTFLTALLICSVFIGAPFVYKSLYYAGTPLYPFGAGVWPPIHTYDASSWQVVTETAGRFSQVKDSFGHGRSLLDFIKHWWLVAVPEKGVNNAFDYPAGLMYLLCLLPFAVYVVSSWRSGKMPVLAVMVIGWWSTWWFGSQQTRFIIIPLCLMLLIALASLPRISKVLLALLIACMGVETTSLINAHRADWFKPFKEIVRQEDLILMDACRGHERIRWSRIDIAYASCIVDVDAPDPYFVIKQGVR